MINKDTNSYDTPPHVSIAYIKAMMNKSEVSYRCFSSYFVFLAIYSILTVVILALLRTHIYADTVLTGEPAHDIFMNCIYECAWKLISLLPVLFVTLFYKQKVSLQNMGLSIWLYSIIGFVNIFCGFLLPIAAVAVTASYEIADIFGILTSTLVVFICGIFTDKKWLMIFSTLYFFFSAAALSLVGFSLTYSEYTDAVVNGNLAALFGYIKTIVYVLSPSLLYLILSLYMRKLSDKE